MPVVNYHTVNGRIRGETDASGDRRDYLTDALGSVVATVDQAAAVRNTYRYKPYGGFLLQSGPDPEPDFLWTGETGSRKSGAAHAQQYNRARHYARETGRWTSVDPLWPEESAYGYVRGNPTSRIDPSGTSPCPPIVRKILDDLLMSLMFVSWDRGAIRKINSCIQNAAQSKNTTCDPFRPSTADCLRDRFPLVRCGDSNDPVCADPENQGMIDRLPSPVDAKIGPRPTFTLCYDNVCSPSSGMPNYYPGLGDRPSERIWITLLHEGMHGCGFNHGTDNTTGKEPPSTRSCNEIAACCMQRVISQKPTGGCTSHLKRLP